MELKQFMNENRSELSMVEVAHAILDETGDVYSFTELLIAVQDYLGLEEQTMEARMSQFYTDINFDGRFISLGENRWGLRMWYPVDSIDEEIVSTIDDDDLPRRLRRKKKRKVNAFAEGDDIIDYNDDDPEDIDDIYDEDDLDIVLDDYDDDEEEVDDLEGLVVADEEEVENQELDEYAKDLSELGDDDIEIDDDEDLEAFEDEDEELDDLDSLEDEDNDQEDLDREEIDEED